jgi:hypothetical protein
LQTESEDTRFDEIHHLHRGEQIEADIEASLRSLDDSLDPDT